MNINPTKLVLGLLAPLIVAASAWISAAVAKYGVHLDPTGIVSLATAGATAGIAVVLKLIHDVESDVGKSSILKEIETDIGDVKAFISKTLEPNAPPEPRVGMQQVSSVPTQSV